MRYTVTTKENQILPILNLIIYARCKTIEWTSRDGRRKRRQRKDGEKKSTATGERPSRVETTFRGLCPAMDSNGCPVNKYYR